MIFILKRKTMKNNINEISSSEFRNKFKSLGFTEKGSELTSGGEINSAFLDIMNNLVTDWKKMGGSNCPLNFTSGNDKFHKNITDYVSRHTKGEAMDVTLPNGCHSSFITLLKTYKTKYNGFDYIDEYRNPTKKATAGHFHMSYRAGQPENSKGGNEVSSGTTQTSGGGSDTGLNSNDDELLANMYTQGLGLKNLGKAFMGIQEDIIRIKKLMK